MAYNKPVIKMFYKDALNMQLINQFQAFHAKSRQNQPLILFK